jgi:hypothetical protein
MAKKPDIQDCLNALSMLMLDANRVVNKYGVDDNDKPSDWTEWVDLRNSIMKAKYILKAHKAKV